MIIGHGRTAALRCRTASSSPEWSGSPGLVPR